MVAVQSQPEHTNRHTALVDKVSVADGVFGGSGWRGWGTDEQPAEPQNAETAVNLRVLQSAHHHYYAVENMLLPLDVHVACDGPREGAAGGTVGVQNPLRPKLQVSSKCTQIADLKAGGTENGC